MAIRFDLVGTSSELHAKKFSDEKRWKILFLSSNHSSRYQEQRSPE